MSKEEQNPDVRKPRQRKKKPFRKPMLDLLGETIPEPHRLKAQVTYQGSRRHIIVSFTTGDRIKFQLEGLEELHIGCIDLLPLFWQAMRQNPAGEKSPLQPRTCVGHRVKGRGAPGLREYARRYGVAPKVIKAWRAQGADLANPDKMGDHIFELRHPAKRQTRKTNLSKP